MPPKPLSPSVLAALGLTITSACDLLSNKPCLVLATPCLDYTTFTDTYTDSDTDADTDTDTDTDTDADTDTSDTATYGPCLDFPTKTGDTGTEKKKKEADAAAAAPDRSELFERLAASGVLPEDVIARLSGDVGQ